MPHFSDTADPVSSGCMWQPRPSVVNMAISQQTLYSSVHFRVWIKRYTKNTIVGWVVKQALGSWVESSTNGVLLQYYLGPESDETICNTQY